MVSKLRQLEKGLRIHEILSIISVKGGENKKKVLSNVSGVEFGTNQNKWAKIDFVNPHDKHPQVLCPKSSKTLFGPVNFSVFI